MSGKRSRERTGRSENASGSTLKRTAGEYKSEGAFLLLRFFYFFSLSQKKLSSSKKKKKQLPFGYNDASMMMFCRVRIKQCISLFFVVLINVEKRQQLVEHGFSESNRAREENLRNFVQW